MLHPAEAKARKKAMAMSFNSSQKELGERRTFVNAVLCSRQLALPAVKKKDEHFAGVTGWGLGWLV